MCPIRTGTISGILARTTRLRLSVASEIFLATLCGLTKLVIHFFTFTPHHRGSQHTMKCAQPSGDTTRASAHVDSRFPYPLRNQLPHRRELSRQEVRTMRVAVACMLCGNKIRLNAKNCTLHAYTCQPAFSWCEMDCEACGNEALNGESQEWFFHPSEWEEHLRAVIDSKVSVIEEEWVDQKTYEEYLACWGQHLVVRELTDQDEKNIKFLAWLLNHYDTRLFDDPERGEM